ncbi:MAG: hypothetical protein Q8783_02515 [Candidatus Phytoplasma stylosanthis]|nr:hypothetical protein [Candidatus Phytoplasma stylosanthis]
MILPISPTISEISSRSLLISACNLILSSGEANSFCLSLSLISFSLVSLSFSNWTNLPFKIVIFLSF